MYLYLYKYLYLYLYQVSGTSTRYQVQSISSPSFSAFSPFGMGESGTAGTERKRQMEENHKSCQWIKFWFDKYYEPMKDISDAELGILFRNIVFYSRREGENMLPMEPYTRMFFEFLKADIDQRWKEYEEICERNRNNAPRTKRSNVSKQIHTEKKKPAAPTRSKKTDNHKDDDELDRILDELDE